MLNSEKLAIAAHLHVLLRRKTGRVTDTEWMASNTAYAVEIARFAHAAAQTDGHADLAEWASKLEQAMGLSLTGRETPSSAARDDGAPSGFQGAPSEPKANRYIRGIR